MAIVQDTFFRNSPTRLRTFNLFNTTTGTPVALTAGNSSAKCTVTDQGGGATGAVLVNAQACTFDATLTKSWYYDVPASVCYKGAVLYAQIIVYDSGGSNILRQFDWLLNDGG